MIDIICTYTEAMEIKNKGAFFKDSMEVIFSGFTQQGGAKYGTCTLVQVLRPPSKVKHEVLHGQLNQYWLTITTHPKVAYDHVGEKFVVDLGKGAYAEVYGLNRFQRAIQLADTNWEDIDE